jgi:hypothetical protein
VALPPLSPARRKVARVIRWLSLPLAAFVIAVPVMSMQALYREYAGKTLISADIVESELTRSGSRGMGAQYELYVRYKFGDHIVRNHLRVLVSSFSSPRAGGKIDLFVDPKTGGIQDDARSAAWFGVILGAVGGGLLILVGFVATGKMLRAPD